MSRILKKQRKVKVWWNWVCDKTTIFVIFLLVFLWLVATIEFVLHWSWFGTVFESTNVYIDATRAVFTFIGYFLLVSGIQTDQQLANIHIASVEQINVETDLLEPEEYSETTRLLKSLYRDNPVLAKANVEENELDRNLRRFIEILISSEMIAAINATITNNLLQNSSTINIWRSWFRSKQIRDAWDNDQTFYNSAMNHYVEQVLLPSQCCPTPRPPWLVRLAKNPLVIINLVVIGLAVGGTIWWFSDFAGRFDSFPIAVSFYIKAFEALFLSALILLLAFEVRRKAQETQIVEDQLEVSSQEEFVRSHYPESVRFYRQIYPCDTRLRLVNVPAETSEDKEILFNTLFARVLFTDIQISLTLEPNPTPAALRLWRSWFHSEILQQEYCYNKQKCFLESETIYTIDSLVLPWINIDEDEVSHPQSQSSTQ